MGSHQHRLQQFHVVRKKYCGVHKKRRSNLGVHVIGPTVVTVDCLVPVHLPKRWISYSFIARNMANAE